MSWRGILDVGQRITLVERLFNTRMGMGRKDDQFERYLANRPDFYQHQETIELKLHQH